MKKLTIYRLLACVGICLLQSCTFEFNDQINPDQEYSVGNIDFSNLVVLGGSQSAGMMDGALYTEGQNNSYPAMLWEQLSLADTSLPAFVQPAIDSDNGFNWIDSSIPDSIVGRSNMELHGPISLLPSPEIEFSPRIDLVSTLRGFSDGEIPTTFSGDISTLNNYSIPYLKVFEAADSDLADGNFFHGWLLPSSGTSILEQSLESNPTFVILHLGLDDIFHYAAKGLTANGAVTDLTTIQFNDLTPEDRFDAAFGEILDRIEASGATALVMNIPDLTLFPYFQAIPNHLYLRTIPLVDIKAFYEPYNRVIDEFNATNIGSRVDRLEFQGFPTDWSVVVRDTTMIDIPVNEMGNPFGDSQLEKIRQLDGEYVLWSVNETLGFDRGGTIPLEKEFYLSATDIVNLRIIVERYNQIISQHVQARQNMTLFDLDGFFFNIVINSTFYDGVEFTNDMTRSGIFSSDGVNLNQRGNALLTNAIINSLNLTFESNIPEINPNRFPGNVYVNKEFQY